MTSNHLVPLDFEGLCLVIGPIIFPNSVDVVPEGIVKVDLILINEMLKISSC